MIFVTTKYENELKQLEQIILKLGFGEEIIIKNSKQDIPQNTINIIMEAIELYIPQEGLIDLEEERKRLEDEKERLEKEVARCEKMLTNPGFINKAPQTKIEEERQKLEKYKEMLNKVMENFK